MSINNFYYLLKPLLPRVTQLAIRRIIFKRKLKSCRDVWPINQIAGKAPATWQGWPHKKQFAVILTHDVETGKGMRNVRKLAEIDLKYSFKSSFNIVPCKYDIPDKTRKWLTDSGFEVGVHDYNHDGKLYKSKSIFDRRSRVINEYLGRWDACGFRSASMHHNLDWIADLDIRYDCSTFDTDPFEPQSDGVNTIFPFYYRHASKGKGFVEIPYTLSQDFTLFVIKQDKDISVWKEKLEWIAEKGGMVTVIVHPDYINFDNKMEMGCYPVSMYTDLLNHIKSVYKDSYWNPLPHELASFITDNFQDCNESSLLQSQRTEIEATA